MTMCMHIKKSNKKPKNTPPKNLEEMKIIILLIFLYEQRVYYVTDLR